MTEENGGKFKDAFLRQARIVLSDLPDKMKMFDSYWDKQDYRKAYLIYHEAIAECDVDKSEIDEKVESDFYWYFVN